MNEKPFVQEEYEEPLEPLTMEHIVFPLILWLGGLLLSTICFMAEIIVKRFKRNDQF